MRKFELSKAPRSFVLVDRDGDGVWTVAFWHIRGPGSGGDGVPSGLVWDQAVLRGDVSPEAKNTAWRRVAARGGNLHYLLDAILTGSQHDAATTAHYLEAMWETAA